MSEEKPTTANNALLAANDSSPLTKLQTYLDSKTCSCCFNLRPLAKARIVNEREMSGYAAHLWTLKESRWTTEVRAPYFGDESLPQGLLGNIWNDYQFDQPTKTILDKEESQKVVRDLKETQRREPCSKCKSLGEIKCSKCLGFGTYDCKRCHEGAIECCDNDNCSKCKGIGAYTCAECFGNGRVNCPDCLTNGSIPCSDCKGSRFVLVWMQLHVKWENHEALITRDRGSSSILPASEIEKSSGKVTCLEFDDNWDSTQSIDNVLDTCVGLPGDLRANIHEKYEKEHSDKSGKVIRLRCVIQCLHLKEIDYTLDKKPGKTFTFCVYGENENQIYDNQYPYKGCGGCSCILL